MINYALANSYANGAGIRGVSGRPPGELVQLAGFASAGDGGDGLFSYQSTTALSDDGGTVWGKWVRSNVEALNVKHFGATGNGTTDDTTAIQAAINASVQRGTTCGVYFPWGTYLISSSLALPAGTIALAMRGSRLLGQIGRSGSQIYCHAVTGPILDTSACKATLGSLSIDDLVIDGENGGNYTNVSTTATGLLPLHISGDPTPMILNNVHMENVVLNGISAAGSRVLDLSCAYQVHLYRVAVYDNINGYGLFIDSSNSPTTTVSLNKCYLSGLLESFYLGSNTLQVTFRDTEFQTCKIAGSALYGANVLFDGCWFEGMAFSFSVPVITQKLKTSGPIVNSVLYNLGSRMTFRNCVYQQMYHGNADVPAWYEGAGTTQAGLPKLGFSKFDECGFNDVNGQAFFSSATSMANRSGHMIIVEEGAQDSYIQCLGTNIADARCVNEGMLGIVFGSTDVRPAQVRNGRFTYGLYPDNAYTGPLTEWPTGGSNLAGDRVRIDRPAAGGYAEYVCVADGTPGTWKGLGQIQS